MDKLQNFKVESLNLALMEVERQQVRSKPLLKEQESHSWLQLVTSHVGIQQIWRCYSTVGIIVSI